MKQIIQLAYLSEASLDFDKEALFELIEQARDWNKENSITGILVYNSGTFMQMLEGPKETVESLFRRISKDARHQNVNRFFENETDEAIFHAWYMAYKNLEEFRPELQENILDLIEEQKNKQGSVSKKDEILELLRFMRQEF